MPKPSILIIDDDNNQRMQLKKIIDLAGYPTDVADGGEAALALVGRQTFDVVISDLKMPGMTGLETFERMKQIDPDLIFILVTAHGTLETAIDAIRQGVRDYLLKPVNADDLIAKIDRLCEAKQLRQENVALRESVRSLAGPTEMIGSSAPMKELIAQITAVAASDASVLIRGESGTGKELVANALHYGGARAERPFIKVNCAAIPDSLLEDDLFGHEKGAFTNAVAMKLGRFELADGGTLFLDEIGDMEPFLQTKLLRVLQEKEFERVGGVETVRVDVRLIAATSRDLETLVEEGTFREDLYYRINVVPIPLPPLRERKDDIPILAEHFLAGFNAKNGKAIQGFSAEATRFFTDYRWPGNVRELQNLIERAVVLSTRTTIGLDDLQFTLRPKGKSREKIVDTILDGEIPLEQLECDLLLGSLKRADWNQSKAAKRLGLTRRTLQYRMEKHNLKRPDDATADE